MFYTWAGIVDAPYITYLTLLVLCCIPEVWTVTTTYHPDPPYIYTRNLSPTRPDVHNWRMPDMDMAPLKFPTGF